ncbi:SpoIID/LytB domain-containing protein [Oculatella sp. FACHB-28]|uniref:SpoIID/LytB domain-containing protein n=1 Tax=Cyanophyceae TaxID=3028117 RepID=UPI001683E57E|nr:MULTISPECIES: SpoIID/LytB domain-containing protein [Cyanophyceae]MBD1869725.1 SpoIID/LytB domain-containing protein [Cyanobacteria bacterium FACHB-471]MBD1999476.1 SpoIID/LytB domain-containing protein [Leptolyngbya sp. FACHB-541]MBD2059897.1 SpoIID/LytB domain-containing protein [Oculatella sp. FACHB-28]MBD2068597.1 SpoIID/LytB domain-containing protein [Leptolyngbya sp. FACHB-671]
MTSGCYAKSRWFRLQQFTRFTKHSWWFSLLLWLVAIAPAYAQRLEMRVAVEQGVSQVQVGSSTDAVVRDGSGQVLANIPAMNAKVAESEAGRVAIDDWQSSQIWIEPSEGGAVWIGDKWYRGRTLVVPTGNGLTAVNYVDLEHYLYSVVGAEMPTSWPIESLKAQAVAARSYALFQRQTGANEVFDVGDTQAWQVYGGLGEETASTQTAVDQTQGQVLTYNGQIINAVFHSSSGGHTEDVEQVWVSPLAYLRGVPDFDQYSPDRQWVENFSASDLQQRISGVGNIVSFTPEEYTRPGGRVRRMRVVGESGSRIMTGDEIRRALGLKSTLFAITPQFEPVASAGETVPSRPVSFQVVGGGFGHGVGMSQWGAYGMAMQGQNYQQIVRHYYTGAILSQIEVR